MKYDSGKLLFAVDLAGTLLFGIEGATAAIAGSAAMILGRRVGLPSTWAAVVGGILCFGLRLVSVWQHWNLPTVSG